jgi:hypothetical protein
LHCYPHVPLPAERVEPAVDDIRGSPSVAFVKVRRTMSS